MPTASVVESRPDLSDEDTRQCKPFADGSDGQHRVTCLVWCQHAPGTTRRSRPGSLPLPHITPSGRQLRCFQECACLAGSAMSCDHLQGRLHLLFSMHHEPAHSGPSEPQGTHSILTRARSLPWHPNACEVTLAQALVLDRWSLLQPLQCE